MFATLGAITFELLGSPYAYEASYRWTYAEHEVVEARPLLQWISEELQIISVDLRFHASFTDPAAQLDSLLATARAHRAQALVLGNGEHQGYFVITALRIASTVTTASGDIISLTVHMELKEWAFDSELDPTVAPQPTFTPIAIVPAPVGDSTSPVTYSGALGVAAIATASGATYVATTTGAPGISPILSDILSAGAPSALVTADDVPANLIVRSAV
jgi:phage protein U